MLSRRKFAKVAASAGIGGIVLAKSGLWVRVFASIPGGSLDPDKIPKFVTPLLVPLAMPKSASDATADYYTIAARQFTQQILPAGFSATTVWGYGTPDQMSSFSSPARTIEAVAGRQVRVTWRNELVGANGNFLPHLFAVDQTLHWANPPGGASGRDSSTTNPNMYAGPVPLVTHVHGAHATDESDGYPEAWFLPAANNIPAGYATEGTWYAFFRAKAKKLWGTAWAPGTSTFVYGNDQRPTTLWYHDHTLGLTRLNVYAGLAGFYLLRGGPDDLVAGQLPGSAYDIPLLIQDRSFNANGSLFYPDNRAFFEGLRTGQLRIPFIPDYACSGPSDISPIWNPEFFGNAMVVNGRTWPYFDVENRRYRFRVLNGCNTRVLMLDLDRPAVPIWQIGGDGGYLPQPVRVQRIAIAPAERADVIVDFTNLSAGTTVTLRNVGPDEPFGGGEPGVDFDAADPRTTGLVLQFRVVAATGADLSTPVESLVLPARTPLADTAVVRRVSINELDSDTVLVDHRPGHGHSKKQPSSIVLACDDPDAAPFGPRQALLGTVASDAGMPLGWMDDISENPRAGDTEVWEIHNYTEDAHPIHIHLVQFEVVEREDANGVVRPPEPVETGTKDTVVAYPDEITRVKATFDREGQYVWHCHILEHEDNEMMRPYAVGKPQNPNRGKSAR